MAYVRLGVFGGHRTQAGTFFGTFIVVVAAPPGSSAAVFGGGTVLSVYEQRY
jgi:hypothetical protein